MTLGENNMILDDLILLNQLEKNAFAILSGLTPSVGVEYLNYGIRIWLDFKDDLIYAFICDCMGEERGDWLCVPTHQLHLEEGCQTCQYLASLNTSLTELLFNLM